MVKIGSAHCDENGNAHGGKAGDQTGRELSIENWYLHSKGWYVARCVDIDARRKIADAMIKACNNPFIGYDQYQRNTLYSALVKNGFRMAMIKSPVETDCSALTRACIACAGYELGDFNTATEKSVLKNSGLFQIMDTDDYCKSSEKLIAGDILFTRSKGHSVIVTSSTNTDTGKEVKSGEVIYTVKVGDCLYNIARDFMGSGAKYREIMEYNGLKSNVIKVGQKIRIPVREV